MILHDLTNLLLVVVSLPHTCAVYR